MILKVREDFMVCKQRDFIAEWFTLGDFHTLEAMFLLTTTAEKEAALSLFCRNSGFPRKTTFVGKQELIYGEKKRKY